MIHWRDQALIIRYARHGETSAIIEVFSQNHGRHLGVVRGGASRKNAPALQSGNTATIEYSARLETHLGSMRIDNGHSYLPSLMADPKRLAAFNSMAALLRHGMEERDAHPKLYKATLAWFDSDDWIADYIRWELLLLNEAGFELELDHCAVTGSNENLGYVSPKSGRAVATSAAGKWADRLLPYSATFAGETYQSNEDVNAALATTGYFLQHWLGSMVGNVHLPDARGRLLDQLQKP